MNLIRTCRGQLLLTLVLFLAILAMPFRDYTERDFTAEDMNYPEEFHRHRERRRRVF